MAHESERTINRKFFGSEHGKNECDAEIGILNQAVDRAIVAKHALINNAKDLYDFCKENLENEDPFSKRTFLFVSVGEVNRDRPQTKAKTIPNTRKIHQMINVKTQKDKVRNLSCFCRNCELGNKDCLNSKYVNPYETKPIMIEKSSEMEYHQNVDSYQKPKLGDMPHLAQSASRLPTEIGRRPLEHELSEVPLSVETSQTLPELHVESLLTPTMSAPPSYTPTAALHSLTEEPPAGRGVEFAGCRPAEW